MSTPSIEDVLRKHLWHHTRHAHCACGFRTPLAQLAIEGYLTHVADAIRAHLAEHTDEADKLRDERNHWIGEAKRYEFLYRVRDEAATRWFRKLKEALADKKDDQ